MPEYKQWLAANREHMMALSCAVELTLRRISQWLQSSKPLSLQEQNEITAGLRDIYTLQKLIKSAPKTHAPCLGTNEANQDGKTV
jgi:hypothetical protein